MSYGVIEHFYQGPDFPMKAMYDILKSGGMEIITIPSFNVLRFFEYYLSFLDLRKLNLIRKLFHKDLLFRNKRELSYYVEPQCGNFFEYRFTPKQFEHICKRAGFKIIKSIPIAHVDGLFHSPFRFLVKFDSWEFKLSKLGYLINKFFKSIPFFHNHMHMCILRKE